jgi:predicted aspartyl protease
VPANAPVASFMSTPSPCMLKPLMVHHVTVLVIFYTCDRNGICTSNLVDCGAISNYISLALFGSLDTPIKCTSLAPILATNGHIISLSVQKTTVKCHFNRVDGDTEEHFTVAPIIHSVIL